ncbi:MAG: protein kinase domain-containing protein [Planctomycetaceae bacterium]
MPAPEYMALLKKTGLLSSAQWTIAEEVAARVSVPAALSAELVRLGLLTSWQSMQLLKGQTGFVLHHYRLLEAIGRGGMGHVFKAQDHRTSGIVAIKVMSRKLSANQNLVSRFRREIRASSRLNSPNIVRTIDAGRVGKIDFMVMEFVNGDQLDSILARLPLIPPTTACEIIRQAALGLQHAHECRMVHRDIKPGNLMIDWDAEGRGVVKIMDMGLVRLDEEKEELTAVTRAGQVMGTPDYMSPEQGWNTAQVDIRSDIYSLGCTFYRMLTGRMPFPGDNPLQVLMARCSKDAPSPKLLRPEIPDAVDAIARRMTLRDPDARYQTPAELAAALEPLCAPLTIEALRQCAREQGADEEAILLDAASRVDLSDPQDPGYQQFLREMDTGASVDLMMTNTPSGGVTLSATFPVIQERRSVSGERRSGESIAQNRSRRTAILAVLIAAAFVLATGAFVALRQPTSSTPAVADKNSTSKQSTQTTKEITKAPSATLATAPPLKLAPGDQLDYDPEFDGPAPKTPAAGTLSWKLVAGAPPDVTIDARTGHIRWKIPDSQSNGAVPIPFMLIHTVDGSEAVVAHSQIVASIKSSSPEFQLVPPKTIRVRPGQSFAQRIEAVPTPRADGPVKFRLAGKILEGMQIDGRGGEFRWTPRETHVGTHQLTVELHDPQNNTTLATTALEVVVVPDRFTLTLPNVTPQFATPGQTLRIPLYPDPPPPGLGKVFNLQLDTNGLPPGVRLENGGEVLVWNVPADAAGAVNITLRPQLLIEGLPLPDNFQPAVVPITVGGRNAPAPANSPDPEAVAAAEKEIREIRSRDLSTTSKRTAALREFLEKALRQQPQAADLALLNIVLKSEGGTKAADSILDAAILRHLRYGSEIPPEIVQLCTQLRPGTLNSLQGDRLSESCLTLAEFAAAAQRWTDVVEFLRIPIEFNKKTGRSSVFPDQYGEELTKAQNAALKLSEGASDSADLLKQDIATAINSWKFQPVFRGPSTEGHYSFTAKIADTPIPDALLSSWTFNPESALLKGPRSPFGFGFLDPAISGSHWVFRTQIASGPASCRFVLGTRKGTTVEGFQLILEATEFGHIKVLEDDNKTSSPPNALPSGPAPRWNNPGALHDLEIRLHERELRVRIDGAIVVSTALPKPPPGPAGFLAFMANATDGPVIELRRPRFIRLP